MEEWLRPPVKSGQGTPNRSEPRTANFSGPTHTDNEEPAFLELPKHYRWGKRFVSRESPQEWHLPMTAFISNSAQHLELRIQAMPHHVCLGTAKGNKGATLFYRSQPPVFWLNRCRDISRRRRVFSSLFISA